MIDEDFIEFIGTDVMRVLKPIFIFDVWFVGGAVRNYLLNLSSYRDLDLVVENRDYSSLLECLDKICISYSENRHGNRRYLLSDGLSIDVWSPKRFFSGFLGVEKMLEYSDFTCNAVGFSFVSGFYSSDLSMKDIDSRVLRPIAASWDSSSAEQYSHLVGRACKFITQYGFLPVDLDRFECAISKVSKSVLYERYGLCVDSAYETILGK